LGGLYLLRVHGIHVTYLPLSGPRSGVHQIPGLRLVAHVPVCLSILHISAPHSVK
jgi:hypothetical protein